MRIDGYSPDNSNIRPTAASPPVRPGSPTPGDRPSPGVVRFYQQQSVHDVEAIRQLGSSTLAGLSPAHSQRIAGQYQEAFQGDLRADIRQNRQVGEALTGFVQRAREGAPVAPQPVGQDTLDFAGQLESLFDQLDRDRDGRVEKSELRIAVHNKNLQGPAAAAVVTLLTLMDTEEGSPYARGITRQQIRELKEGKAPAKLSEFSGGYFSHFQRKLSAQSRSLFGCGGPNAQKLEQGQYGTCYFLAALVAKAQQDPQGLRNMVKDNGNGTYTVTFPGQPAVVVEAPTDAEMLYGASSGSDGMWATLFEKAYAQLKAGGRWDPNSDPMEEVEGGDARTGMKAFTSGSTDVDELAFTRESTTREKIKKALAAGKMITCATSRNLYTMVWHKIVGDVIPGSHVYTVIGFDERSDKVKVRNPWGSGEPENDQGRAKDGSNDGVFELTIAEFDDLFTDICYQE